jgi:hypothetical protein
MGGIESASRGCVQSDGNPSRGDVYNAMLIAGPQQSPCRNDAPEVHKRHPLICRMNQKVSLHSIAYTTLLKWHRTPPITALFAEKAADSINQTGGNDHEPNASTPLEAPR